MGRIGRAVLAVVVVLSGCGGDEISREEYLRRAQEICDKGNDELEKASEEAFAEIPEGERPTDEQFEAYARETVVPMVRDQVRQLRDLPPPEGGAEEVDEIYDAIDEALDRLDDYPRLVANAVAHAEAHYTPAANANRIAETLFGAVPVRRD